VATALGRPTVPINENEIKGVIMIKKLIQRISRWFAPKRTPEIPQRKTTGLPAMERRLKAARNIVDGSLMDKE
tara:strand:+ start:799 stop:1017 length:219 start_codon:yes stop_codon:yes gene_type:complete